MVMGKPRHKNDSREFAGLTHTEQAKSITASINNLQRAIVHHICNSDDLVQTRKKCLKQVNRFLGRLLDS